MSDILEFIIRGKDMLSGLFPKIGTTAQHEFARVDAIVGHTQTNMAGLGDTVRLNVDTSGVDRANAQVKSLGEQMTNLNTPNLIGGVAVGQMVSRGVEGAVGFVKDQITETLKAGMDASKLQAEFGVLAGKEGPKLFSDINKYVGDSIFGPELFGDAKVLLSYGEAANKIMPDIKMLGDIAMGDAEKMKHLTVAFGQVMSTGHLMGQDLNQMIQGAGFNPLMVIAEHTHGHKSITARYEELKELAEKGEISFDMVRHGFELATTEGGKFYQMLENIGQTPAGKLQAMLGNIDMSKMSLGIQELPGMARILDELKPIVDDLPNALERMKPGLDAMVNGFADSIHWVKEHNEGLGRIVSLLKIGVEAWVAWKVGTAALTAANWLYVNSLAQVGINNAAIAAETTEVTSAIALENEELIAQGEIVAGLREQWVMMGAAEKAAILQGAAGGGMQTSLLLPQLAAANGAGASMMAGGLMAAVNSVAVPLTIGFFTGQALEAIMGTKGTYGTKEDGSDIEWWNAWQTQLLKQRYQHYVNERDELIAHPLKETAPILGKDYGKDVMKWDALKGLVPFGQIGDNIGDLLASRIAKGTKDKKDALTDVTDQIISGGKRSVTINVNHELVKQIITVASKKDADGIALTAFEEELFRTLDSAAGAVHG